MIYKAFIISNFNLCSKVWHFCNQSSVNKIEKIQERALRFICDDCLVAPAGSSSEELCIATAYK